MMLMIIVGVCTLPLATAFAPVVNDALTSNETLAAARNAFLISHLFDELANDNKVGEDEGRRQDLYGELARGGQLPNRSSSSTTMKMMRTTSWSSTTTARRTEKTTTTERTTTKEEEEEEDKSEPKQQMMAPIRPINRQQQQQQQRDQQAVMAPDSGANSRMTTSLEEEEDDGQQKTGEGPNNGTKGPSTAEVDQKQQGKTETINDEGETTISTTTRNPDTTNTTASVNASLLGVAGPPAHPEWLRTLFFTVICTGIGFFLLMLLAGLITRCEQPNDADNGIGDQHHQQQQNRGDRVQPTTSSHSSNPNASGGAASSSSAATEAVATAQRRGELAIHTPAEHRRSMALGDLVRVPTRTGDASAEAGRGHAEPVLVVKPAAYL